MFLIKNTNYIIVVSVKNTPHALVLTEYFILKSSCLREEVHTKQQVQFTFLISSYPATCITCSSNLETQTRPLPSLELEVKSPLQPASPCLAVISASPSARQRFSCPALSSLSFPFSGVSKKTILGFSLELCPSPVNWPACCSLKPHAHGPGFALKTHVPMEIVESSLKMAYRSFSARSKLV